MPEFLGSGRKCWTLDSGHWTLDAGLWMLDSGRLTLNAGSWTLDSGRWILDTGFWAPNGRLWTYRLLTAKSQSVREASHQPAFMDNCLTISHTCLPCPPSRSVSPCVLCLLMIELMVVLLTLFRGGEYGFSNMGAGAILGNGCGIQGQNNVTLLQGSEMTAGFHYRNCILRI